MVYNLKGWGIPLTISCSRKNKESDCKNVHFKGNTHMLSLLSLFNYHRLRIEISVSNHFISMPYTLPFKMVYNLKGWGIPLTISCSRKNKESDCKNVHFKGNTHMLSLLSLFNWLRIEILVSNYFISIHETLLFKMVYNFKGWVIPLIIFYCRKKIKVELQNVNFHR